MKNKVKALISHLIIVGVSSILLLMFVAIAPAIGKYTNYIAIRVPLVIVLILSYVYVGTTLLDTKMDKNMTFLQGVLLRLLELDYGYTPF